MIIDEIWFETDSGFEVSNKGNVKSIKTGRLLTSDNIRIGSKVVTKKRFIINFFKDNGILNVLDPLFSKHGNCNSYLIRTPDNKTIAVNNLQDFCKINGLVYATVITNIHRGKKETNGFTILEGSRT